MKILLSLTGYRGNKVTKVSIVMYAIAQKCCKDV